MIMKVNDLCFGGSGLWLCWLKFSDLQVLGLRGLGLRVLARAVGFLGLTFDCRALGFRGLRLLFLRLQAVARPRKYQIVPKQA